MPELMSIDDIAQLFRANRRVVAEQWLHRPDFPSPYVAPSRKHRLWKAADVIAWAQRGTARSARRKAGSTCSEAG